MKTNINYLKKRIMTFKSLKYIIQIAVLVFVLNSCGVVNKKYVTPDIEHAESYRDTIIQDTTTIANLPWKALISDSILQNLIEEGLQNNLDLKVAIENINQAKASLTEARLQFLPSLEGSAQITRSRSSETTSNLGSESSINVNTTSYLGQLSSSWELDVWESYKAINDLFWLHS